MKIYKYQLEETFGYQKISMPKNSTILCIQIQKGCPVMWAKVNEDYSIEERTFVTYGTGVKMLITPKVYIGTYQAHSLVYHVFEEINT